MASLSRHVAKIVIICSRSSSAATTTTTTSPSLLQSSSSLNTKNIVLPPPSLGCCKSPRFWKDYNMEGWSVERLYDTVRMHQQDLESNDQLLLTWTGHGDCKPCNLILLHDNHAGSLETATTTTTTTTLTPHSSIKFIDLELTGVQYVAYDLAKFWRRNGTGTNNEPSSSTRNRRAFLQTYADETTTSSSSRTSRSSSSSSENMLAQKLVDVQELEWQMKLLLPLTWLEAAIFFACMANTAIGAAAAAADASRSSSSRNGSPWPQYPFGKNTNVDQWMNLALDRLKSYERCISSSDSPTLC
jgi:Choline/ethanolamine kinase